MARIQKPPAGRLVISVIHSSLDALADALKALEKRFGRVQCETEGADCHEADMYREEMGYHLQRRFFSFDRPVWRDSLPDLKATCHKIEAQFADRVRDDYFFRTVNLDPGVLSPINLVMASHRELGHRIYLKDGVFAELALVYSRGQFVRLPWTSEDYVTPQAIEFFTSVRQSFDLLYAQNDSYAVAANDR